MRSATAGWLDIVPRNTKTGRQWRGLLLVLVTVTPAQRYKDGRYEIELEMMFAEDYVKFYNHGEGPYYGLLG